jgi:hypothetical protein
MPSASRRGRLFVRQRAEDTDMQLEERFRRFRSDCLPIDQADMIRAFAVKYMGEPIAPAETIRSWMAVNPRLFFGLSEVTDGGPVSSRLVGYFSLRPVTRRAAELLDSCRIDGGDMRPEHILPPGESPEAVYVGGVVAEGPARAALLLSLSVEVRRYREQGVGRFYTKPVTPDGKRLVLNNGFLPVVAAGSASKGVYRLILPG